jgi:hypothetical protein
MKKILAVILLTLLTPVLAWGQGYWDPNGFAYTPQLTTQGTTDYANIVTSQARIDAILGASPYIGGATTIAGAVTAIGSTTPATLHVPPGTWPVAANTTITANILLKPESGAVLTVANGVTLTINGPFQAGLYQVFSCAGTGQVVFGKPSVERLVPQWWGAKGDDSNNDSLALQAMANCSMASGNLNMFCPAGIYKLTDTLQLGYGSPPGGFFGCLFEGAGGNGGNYNAATQFDATSFGDRPAIAISNGRNVVPKHFRVFGKNIAPQTAAVTANGPDPVEANWVTAGCNDTQYSPYCGIAVDPYAGTAPVSGGYTNAAYGQASSSGTFMEDVLVQGFVVGLMLSPNSNNADDFFSAKDCDIMYNTYAYSSGGSQSDSINLYNSWLERCWCCQTTAYHGPQAGHLANMFGGGLQVAWKLFEGVSNGSASIEGIWCEDFNWIGNFGIQSGNDYNYPINFVGCNFQCGAYYEPYLFTARGNLKFDSCEFYLQATGKQVINFINTLKNTFVNCLFWGYPSGAVGFVGVNTYGGNQLIANDQYINCTNTLPGAAPQPCINNECLAASGYMPTRQPIAAWTHTARLFGDSGFTNYHIILPSNTFQTPPIGVGPGQSGGSITGTDHNAVLTFTYLNTGEVLIGDLILWLVNDRTGTVSNMIPAFQVTGINTFTGIATAHSLVDNINTASAPNWIYGVIPLFFNVTPATGNTHTNTTVDNVTNIGNFAVGDWIQGAGIAGARITNIVGTTITLSRAASATATGVSIYNCGLTAY